MASIHETAEGLHAAGVMDKQTMRKFDDACLMAGEIRSGPLFSGGACPVSRLSPVPEPRG
jgi:hypothetical protein